MHLNDADRDHLTAARGYLDLAMAAKAHDEIELISFAASESPEVLKVRVATARALGRWDELQSTATRLSVEEPRNIEWVVAMVDAAQGLGSLSTARDIIVEALVRLPHVAVLVFHLARIECLSGNVAESRRWIRKCIQIDPAMRFSVLDDPDLREIWS
jgi:hypothetical protein